MPQCFKEGTLVQTKTGHKKIEDIKVNDEVWSYNEKTQKKELKKVKRIFRNKTKQWLHLYIQEEDIENNKISNEEIISTPEHKYYLPNLKKWISAKSLEVGTKVLMSNGKYGIINISIQVI